MQLKATHIKALDEAEKLISHCDFCPYLDLKALLHDKSPNGRRHFRTLFTHFYGLNVGGLTDAFKDEYFKLLFDGNVVVGGKPSFKSILLKLHRIKRKKGDIALPLSFVSKLVAMHQESSPIFDRHVLAFFGKQRMSATADVGARIKWFTDFLKLIEVSYKEWATDARVRAILDRLRGRDPELKKCDDVRLMDFLVWKVGNQKLL